MCRKCECSILDCCTIFSHDYKAASHGISAEFQWIPMDSPGNHSWKLLNSDHFWSLYCPSWIPEDSLHSILADVQAIFWSPVAVYSWGLETALRIFGRTSPRNTANGWVTWDMNMCLGTSCDLMHPHAHVCWSLASCDMSHHSSLSTATTQNDNDNDHPTTDNNDDHDQNHNIDHEWMIKTPPQATMSTHKWPTGI